MIPGIIAGRRHGGGGGGGTDPFFANVISLIHWDGAEGSTSFTDQIAGRTWTNGTNGGKLTTTGQLFGSAALLFSGSSNNQINTDTHADWGYGTGNFTIEFWVYMPSVPSTVMLWDQRVSATNPAPALFKQGSNLIYYVSGGVRISATSPLVASAWQHLAVCRSGSSTRLFHNGIQVGSTWTTDSTNYAANRARIGTNADTAGGFGTFTGMYDDIRVTKGVARYTENFIPPSEPFPNS